MSHALGTGLTRLRERFGLSVRVVGQPHMSKRDYWYAVRSKGGELGHGSTPAAAVQDALQKTGLETGAG
jgi:hypothetical protein